MALSYMVRRANDVLGPVQAAVDTFGGEVAAVLKTKTDPFVPEGSSNVDYGLLMQTDLALSSAARDAVFEKGKVYSHTKGTKNESSAAFRDSIKAVASEARSFRSALVDHYGPTILSATGLADPLGADNTHMIAEVEHALELYKELDKSRFSLREGVGDFGDEARILFIEGKLEECRQKKKTYELAVKENDRAREALNESYAEFRRVFVNTTEVIESLFRMAGFDEQADRLRYLVRRARTKSATGASQEPGAEPTPPSPDPATGPGAEASSGEAASAGTV